MARIQSGFEEKMAQFHPGDDVILVQSNPKVTAGVQRGFGKKTAQICQDSDMSLVGHDAQVTAKV